MKLVLKYGCGHEYTMSVTPNQAAQAKESELEEMKKLNCFKCVVNERRVRKLNERR